MRVRAGEEVKVFVQQAECLEGGLVAAAEVEGAVAKRVVEAGVEGAVAVRRAQEEQGGGAGVGLGQAEALILFIVCAIVGVTQVMIGKKGEVEA